MVKAGLLSERDLQYALRVREKMGKDYPLTRVLQELGKLDDEKLRKVQKQSCLSLPLGDMLVELGHLKPQELRAASAMLKTPEWQGRQLAELLVAQQMIPEHVLLKVMADKLGYPVVQLNEHEVDKSLLDQVSLEWCRRHQVMPVKNTEEGVQVAFADPADKGVLQAAEVAFDRQISPAIVSRQSLEKFFTRYEREAKKEGKSASASGKVDTHETTLLVNRLISDAISKDASDVHIEPMKDYVRIRVRCDGMLMQDRELSKDALPGITGRLKVMAKADIAERRRHQGGGFKFEDKKSGLECDVRVSFYNTIFGEKIVLRLLTRKASMLDVADVGMAPRMLQRFIDDALEIPSGVILITGPTGSGKTTTLYGCVNYLNDSEHAIITAEDPVEYVIEGIAQCSLNAKIDLTFEESLRHMVRQDPDVIVLGEVRDRFSAEAAIQAALTGHKVLTTFHTEDSIGGLLRLINMNIETFLISSTVVSVLAQRLLRRVCPHCAETYRPTVRDLQRLRVRASDLAGADFKQGKGCHHCHYTGYSGRVGVFELLVLNEPVKDAILNCKTSLEIRRISVETSGLITLVEDGIAKAAKGQTSIQEVLRHLPRLSPPRSLEDIFRLAGVPE
ncbi:MAG TPA: type II/IV secretion system protein [Chromatiaceae bacterium]|nr:type II/IV secretion system protein [Chromatiaceae bacterium]